MVEQDTGGIAEVVEQSGDEKIVSREEKQIEEERKALVTFWVESVREAKEHWYSSFKSMSEDMRFCAGEQSPGLRNQTAMQVAIGSFEAGSFEAERYQANIVLRHVQTRTANIYGKNPRIIARRKQRMVSTVWNGSMQQLTEAQQMMQVVSSDPNAAADPYGPRRSQAQRAQ